MSNSGKRAEIVRLYQLGHRVNEIASATGVHRATVYNNLKAAGVTPRDDRLDAPGRPPGTTHCSAGHPWSEENTRRHKNGSRSCRMCEMLRQFMKTRTGDLTVAPRPE